MVNWFAVAIDKFQAMSNRRGMSLKLRVMLNVCQEVGTLDVLCYTMRQSHK